MPGGSIGGNSTGGSGGHPGAAAAPGGAAAYGYAGGGGGGGGGDGGGGGGSGGGGGGWRQRNFVGVGGSAARAGYGFVVTMDLEPGMSGDRRALWTCFCSFKTRRKRCVLS